MSNENVDELGDCEISNMAETKVATTPEVAATIVRSLHGPQAVDQALRAAVGMCWVMLPDERRNADAVECEMRRLLDRVIANLREDAKAFAWPMATRTLPTPRA
jgi:hypothetical protein